jgi:hypothetical protein
MARKAVAGAPRTRRVVSHELVARAPDALTASAASIPLGNMSWDSPREHMAWQREVWRLLEIVGELEAAAKWVASHLSRIVLRMHDIDENGEIGAETRNKKARAIAARTLGTPGERAEALRIAGYNHFLVGEVYLGALSGTGPRGRDEWFACSTDDIEKEPGARTAYIDLGNGKKPLRPGRDLLVRSWTPHPKKGIEPSSATRSARIVLREIEQLTRFIFAQIDSRLSTGGVLVVPAGMSLGDGTASATDLMRKFVEVATEAMKGHGTASQVVPTVLEVPADACDKVQFLSFASELSKQALALREEAAGRLARMLDLPAEQLTGIGDTNHWSSYQISPEGIKVHIEPLAARLCLALQRGWVESALVKEGLNPDKFHIWFDTAPLIVRPNRFQEALELWREGLLSAEAVLDAAAFYSGDAPEDKEAARRYLRELVLRDPQLFNQAAVRTLLGFTEEMLPAPPPVDGEELLTDSATPPPPPPAPETLPEKPTTGKVPEHRERGPKGVTASAAPDAKIPLLLIMGDAVVVRALELAGGRLLTHETRGTLKAVPRHELHTRIPVDESRVEKLLAGSMDTLPLLAAAAGLEDAECRTITDVLARHCRDTLLSGEPHSRNRMSMRLQVAGVFDVGH